MLVHPDKNPGDEAREAFEALNEAHRQLRDRGGLVSLRTPNETNTGPSMSEHAMQCLHCVLVMDQLRGCSAFWAMRASCKRLGAAVHPSMPAKSRGEEDSFQVSGCRGGTNAGHAKDG